MRRSMPVLPNQAAWVDRLARILVVAGWEDDRITEAALALVDFDRYARSDMRIRRTVDAYLGSIGARRL
jgi:hypothetical protein